MMGVRSEYLLSFSLEATLKGKNLLPGSKFFPLRVASTEIEITYYGSTNCLAVKRSEYLLLFHWKLLLKERICS